MRTAKEKLKDALISQKTSGMLNKLRPSEVAIILRMEAECRML